ncbi:hypothetical protein [Micromonospora maris]|uniref:hypothetical protein n=1 Tax=Micromonospora maris TaxID=1003110 RepID=UPI002E13E623|nr:hypothetical protein OG712_14230 [Micromonospora maris]
MDVADAHLVLHRLAALLGECSAVVSTVVDQCSVREGKAVFRKPGPEEALRVFGL